MPKLITSWDDGYEKDIGLAQMLKSHNIPGIFYIPNQIPNFSPEDVISEDAIKQLHRDGFEIGGHTFSHPNDLKLLEGSKLRDQIVKNKEWLENIIGAPITKFCYPSGRYNDATIEVLKELGFKEARTVVVMNTTKPENPFRTATSVHVYPHRKEYGGRSWGEVARDLYKKAIKKEGGYFHLWGHSWEIEKFRLWEELDEFFECINIDMHKWNQR